MPFSADGAYPESLDHQPLVVNEHGIEDAFISKLRDLKYTDRPDILMQQLFPSPEEIVP